MSHYRARIRWNRGEQMFTDQKYSRGHTWEFDQGLTVPASASPHVVPPPLALERAVDPEEAFVAALSSCHMLWFLSLAARRGLRVDSYHDDASGVLGSDAQGRKAITVVTLRPRIVFSGTGTPSGEELAVLHEQAHHECFIANSVKTEVRLEPAESAAAGPPTTG